MLRSDPLFPGSLARITLSTIAAPDTKKRLPWEKGILKVSGTHVCVQGRFNGAWGNVGNHASASALEIFR